MNTPTHGAGSDADLPSEVAANHVHADDAGEDAITQAALRYLDNPATALEIDTDTPPNVRAAVEILATVRDDHVALGHIRSGESAVVAPPLTDDPLAVALGLVEEEQVVLSGPALKNARQRARLKVSELAKHLTGQGHHVRAGELQSWESAEDIPTTPELLAAIARILDAPVSQLGHTSNVPPPLATSRRFHHLVRRFATVRKISLLAAQSVLLAAAAAPARRGDTFDDEHVLDALDAFVQEHERRAGEER